MAMHWVLVADASRARLFSANDTLTAFELINDLAHVRARMKGSEVESDDRGRSSGGPHGPHSGMEERESLHHREEQVFAHTLADTLEKGAHDNAYERLIVAAAPHFLGVLRGVLPRSVEKRTVATINRDFTHVPDHELGAAIRPHLPDTAGMP